MLRDWFRDAFAALGVRDYRVYWGGTVLMMLAFMMSFTVQSVVAFELKGTNSAVGLVNLGLGVSMLVLSPLGGVIADRVSKRRLLTVALLVVALSLLATGILLIVEQLTIFRLTLAVFVMGAAFSFSGPARQAYVGEMVPRPLLANAVALGQLGMNIGRVAAPLLAGAMLASAAIDGGGTYIFMAALIGIVLISLVLLPASPGTPPEQRRAVRRELLSGFRYVHANPRLQLLILLFMAFITLGFMFQIVLPALLVNHFNREATDVGLILTINAIAGVAVSLLLAGAVSGRWAWPLMLSLAAVMGVGFLLLAVAPSYTAALLTMLVMGPGLAGFMLVNNALVMSASEPAYYGRVMSVIMLAFGVQGVAGAPLGVLADEIGERETLAAVGAATLVVVALGAASFAAIVRRSGAPAAARSEGVDA